MGEGDEKAGITATPYDLRHSFGSLLIHEGRSVPVVAALMGHSRPSTTLDTYSHEFHQHRLGTGVVMVDAIEKARKQFGRAAASPRRLRQAAP